jgi:hypothetical protein
MAEATTTNNTTGTNGRTQDLKKDTGRSSASESSAHCRQQRKQRQSNLFQAPRAFVFEPKVRRTLGPSGQTITVLPANLEEVVSIVA